MFKHLKNEILLITLGLTISTIIVTAVFGVFSIRSAGNDAEEASSIVLRDQSKDVLVQIARATAERQDLLFERTRNEATNLAAYLQNVYDNPARFDRNYWRYESRVYRDGLRYLNRPSDVSTIFIPQYTKVDQKEIARMELSAYLDFVAPSVLASNQDSVAVYTIDPAGFSRYFPNIVLGNVAPPEHSTLADIVYIQGTPEKNPEKKVVWSPLYADPAKRGLMITATAPVYTKNGFEGTIGIDVLLNRIIQNITSYSPVEGSYAFLIGNTKETIAFPDPAYKDILGREKKEGETQVNFANELLTPEFKKIYEGMIAGEEGFSSIIRDGKEFFIAYAPLKETGFSVAIVAEGEVLLKVVASLHGEIANSIQENIWLRIFPASTVIILFAIFMSIFLVSQIVRPILGLTTGAEEIKKGNFDYKLNIRSKNEIGALATAFTQMSAALKYSQKKLQEYSQGLEKKVEERTEDLTQANMRLQELDKKKSEFVSISSHQLRTPLTAIKGYASLLLEGSYGEVPEKLKDPLQKIFDSSTLMTVTISDFLDVAKIEEGKMQYDTTVFDLKQLVTEVVTEFKAIAARKNITLTFLPTPNACMAKADSGKVRQILNNLLDNSLRYTTEGTIEVLMTCDSGKHIVSVSDTGIGMSKSVVASLFHKFMRAENASRHAVNGTGLGLYVNKQMIDAMGGRIWAESPGEGKGSTFHIELPAAQDTATK